MPTFVYMTQCDGCGHCVDICPSDIMHIDSTHRRAYNIEPNMCWECYSCVKACPQNAIDVRGYADFAPLGHSVRVLREEAKGAISWRVEFRDGRVKSFESRSGPPPGGRFHRPPSCRRRAPKPCAPKSWHTSPMRSTSRACLPCSRANSGKACSSGPLQPAENRIRGRRYPRDRRRHGRLRRHLRIAVLGRDLKIVCVEKANIERSGAVAQGLYAINCYMGMQWDENQPEDHVRYARNDLMGLVREDLGYDIARHVDSTVHKFEEWGLPIMRNPETGRYQREGKWQIMIHGESYKPIVAEAARKAATEVYNRIMVTHLLMDESRDNRVAEPSASMFAPAIFTSSGPGPSSSAPAAHRMSTSPGPWARAWAEPGMPRGAARLPMPCRSSPARR